MMSSTILLVEDNEDDAFFMKRALRDAGIENPVQLAEHGQQAIDYLSGEGKFSVREKFPMPMIVFLDLKLPFKSGHEVLQWIRNQNAHEKLIVIVLSSSNEPVDLDLAYRNGANSYVVKPATTAQLLELAKSFKLWWLMQNKPSLASPS
ncbi:MAG TPA: response regulator [Opitutaceae bacterium]|nr:response regulator [Opitutaceae bacterium]